MQSARGKLKNSLEEVENDEDNEESKEVVERQSRKRQKTEKALAPTTIHQSYVMKLFDRSVDLAKFDERSTLYPICRR